eukprot:GEMP01083693.1.p1 GENE.GEMP01083693.1~~GEMP01083693.1.p1  ORF type:complete len:223 (+),score=55.20 GEMP01083693.1:222-890(+)
MAQVQRVEVPGMGGVRSFTFPDQIPLELVNAHVINDFEYVEHIRKINEILARSDPRLKILFTLGATFIFVSLIAAFLIISTGHISLIVCAPLGMLIGASLLMAAACLYASNMGRKFEEANEYCGDISKQSRNLRWSVTTERVFDGYDRYDRTDRFDRGRRRYTTRATLVLEFNAVSAPIAYPVAAPMQFAAPGNNDPYYQSTAPAFTPYPEPVLCAVAGNAV